MSYFVRRQIAQTSNAYFNVERSSKVGGDAHLMRSRSLGATFGILCAVALGLVGCTGHHDVPSSALPVVSPIQAIDLSVPAQAHILDEGIRVSLAKNSQSQFVVGLASSKFSMHGQLGLPRIPGVSFQAYQVLNAPVDLNDAEYVRQTGEAGIASAVPRVLLPLQMSDGSVDLSGLKESGGSILIWIDVHAADDAVAGKHTAQCVLTDGPAAWNLPVQITVENLTLPKDLHLHFAAPLNWSTLAELYPDTFEAVPPRLLNRGDPRRAKLLGLIEDYLNLAHENKADLYLPRLQPIVKWPLGKTPQVDWTDFDSIVSPWLTGDAFADHRPVGFWPLPATDSLQGFNLASRVQYWQAAADHFEKQGWLGRSPVVLKSENGGAVSQGESILISAEARQILAAQPKVTTLVPMDADQIQWESSQNPIEGNPICGNRWIEAAPGLAVPAAGRSAPAVTGALCWLNAADAVTASASEQGMRSLAWLAFSQGASLVLSDNPVPDDNKPARAGQLIWAYPGEKFGINHPLATVQLKWMRQAEQDYETLLLATQQNIEAMKIAGLETKTVQLSPTQPAAELYSLFAGNTDPHGCEEARQLLVGQLSDRSTTGMDLQKIRWLAAQEKQTVVATSVDWNWDGNVIKAALNLELYNPASEMPNGGQVYWAQAPEGWAIPSDATQVPAIGQFQVGQVTTASHFNLNRIDAASRAPIMLNFVDYFTRQSAPCRVVLPVAVSERRQQPLTLDGQLDDWFAADAVQLNQPLVKMLNRPALQSGTLELSQTPSSIYTGWSDDNFYLAFRLGGVSAADLRSTRNFVQYDQGRAWGEDLCEVLIQPIYIDNTRGSLLHVVCKPGGSWVERQDDQQSWQPFEACGVRYASGVDPAEKVWRGEVAIPWKAINAAGHGRPGLLRFNFIQHQQATAQSASWAGPIDESRDGKLTGLLLLKEP